MLFPIRLDEAVVAADPSAREARHNLGQLYVQLGILLSGQGRRDEAGRWYDRGVGLLKGLIDEGRVPEPL